MDKILKIPLILEPAEEGGWVIRSPIIPELITEIAHIEELESSVRDAVEAARELYEDMGKSFPAEEIGNPVKPLLV
jgi:predicted RNase H-like HicB family nuclease